MWSWADLTGTAHTDGWIRSRHHSNRLQRVLRILFCNLIFWSACTRSDYSSGQRFHSMFSIRFFRHNWRFGYVWLMIRRGVSDCWCLTTGGRRLAIRRISDFLIIQVTLSCQASLVSIQVDHVLFCRFDALMWYCCHQLKIYQHVLFCRWEE